MHQPNQLKRTKDRTSRKARKLIPRLLNLIAPLKSSGFAPIVHLARTLTEWREEITYMWRFTKDNGIPEGFHRKMKLIEGLPYGFRSNYNYRLRVIAQRD